MKTCTTCGKVYDEAKGCFTCRTKALKKCPACGEYVSKNAAACPKCGETIKKASATPLAIILAILVVALVLAIPYLNAFFNGLAGK